MLEKRIIPALLLDHTKLVKSTKFKDYRYIGDPINTVKIFNDEGADEIFILDITASKMGRNPNFELLEEIASEAFMPLGYGGAISDIPTMDRIFKIGYEKISLGQALYSSSNLIPEASRRFGAQSIVATVDFTQTLFKKEYVPYHHVQKKRQKRSLLDFCRELEERGVGELVLNSVNNDGSMSGYESEIISKIAQTLSIPVVALGGCGSFDHMKQILKTPVQAAAAGSLFIYHGKQRGILINYPSRKIIKGLISEG